MREVRILGLDPGSRRLGYGLLLERAGRWGRLDGGVIRLPEKRSLAERLKLAYDAVCALIDAHHPDQIAIEDCFVAHSARAALVLGHVRGVLLLAAQESGAELSEFAPRSVKLAAVGQGGAAKEQVQQMIPRLVAGCPASLSADEADALAVAWCCANQLRSPQRIARRGSK
jgi:crossover junction endodeoxyribonuclease RuvC